MRNRRSAALVGVAFGGDTVVVKLGRQGKKSVEGSVAMFVVCFGASMSSSVCIDVRFVCLALEASHMIDWRRSGWADRFSGRHGLHVT